MVKIKAVVVKINIFVENWVMKFTMNTIFPLICIRKYKGYYCKSVSMKYYYLLFIIRTEQIHNRKKYMFIWTWDHHVCINVHFNALSLVQCYSVNIKYFLLFCMLEILLIDKQLIYLFVSFVYFKWYVYKISFSVSEHYIFTKEN